MVKVKPKKSFIENSLAAQRRKLERASISFLNVLVYIGYGILYPFEILIRFLNIKLSKARDVNISEWFKGLIDVRRKLTLFACAVGRFATRFARCRSHFIRTKALLASAAEWRKLLTIQKRSIEKGKKLKKLTLFACAAERLKHPNTLLLNFGFFAAGIIFTILLIFVPIKIYGWYRALPRPELLKVFSDFNKSTRILDKKGRLLYEIYIDRKYEPVNLERIPDQMIKATLAIEDHAFYSHPGFQLKSILRAVKAYLFEDDLQGASTITQQLVKNVLLTSERTISRKIKEIVLSIMVEGKYSKNEILEMYMNNIPYGGTAWGIQSASKKFFGKDISQLDLAENSFLAGLPSAPSMYSPFEGGNLLSKSRQKLVLQRMVDLKFISQEEADSAFAEELRFSPQSEYIRAPHFVAFVRNELTGKYGRRLVDFGGLTVTTTLDLDLQEKAEDIVSEEISSAGYLNISNGAAIVLNSGTGEILAYVGSIDYFKEVWGAYDIVTASRQPGSTVKVITYSLALSKKYTTASIIDDSPITYQLWGGQTYTPVNYDGISHGKVTLRQALANSYNISAVKTVKELGPDNMVSLGNKMGLKNWKVDGSYGLSVTLGGKETSLMNLTNVFATLSRKGIYKEVTPFESVLDVNGYQIYPDSKKKEERVLDNGVAYLITNILSDYYARLQAFGVNNFLSIPGHSVAVKTGTTDEKRDNYTVGYTPSYAVGVWVGNNDNTPMNRNLASGLSGAAPIWNKIMTAVLENKGDEKFETPANIVVKISKECGNKSEVFIKGTEFVKLCVDKEDKKVKD